MSQRANIMAIHRDRALLHIVEPQQQVHERRFPRTRAPNKPHPAARFNRQIKAAHPAGVASIFKRDIVISDRPRRAGQRDRVRFICDTMGHRERRRAILNDADIREHPQRRPGNPATHLRRAQDQRRRRAQITNRRASNLPQPDGQPNHQQRAKGIEEGQPQAHRHSNAPKFQRRLAQVFDTLTREFFLAARMSEQLHGGHVGKAIDEASIHRRAAFRPIFRRNADARQTVRHPPDINRDPNSHRQRQPPINSRQHRSHPDHIGHQQPDRPNRIEHRLDHGGMGLHLL